MLARRAPFRYRLFERQHTWRGWSCQRHTSTRLPIRHRVAALVEDSARLILATETRDHYGRHGYLILNGLASTRQNFDGYIRSSFHE